MFDRLQEGFESVLRTLKGSGKIRESNISEALEEVKKSLLEADVQYRVVQSFVDSVRSKALGEKVLGSIDPGQQFIKIVYDELVRLLGGEKSELPQPTSKPFLILVAGLQGSGKTTTVAKLAKYLRDEKQFKPLIVPADTQRPAAREQLEQLGKENGLQVFSSREPKAVRVIKDALKAVDQQEVAANCVLVDTAGRLNVDETLMEELKEISNTLSPQLTLYVLDSMAGQNAVEAASTFQQKVGFDGVIVTKLDGDSRGGAALSVSMATGRPIYFVGTGEKVNALEPLYPDRMASRILGMGDVVTLVEKAQEAFDEDQARKVAEKIRNNQFNIEDFQEQLKAMEKMGSLTDMLDYIPGASQLKKSIPQGLPEGEIKRVTSIINSMTREEKQRPDVLNGGRRIRIAKGSGTSVPEVNRFMKQFLQARQLMTRMSRIGAKGMKRGGFPPFQF